MPDRLMVTRDGYSTGTSEYVMMDTSIIGGYSPARVAETAKQSASSASEERERTRQRSDSLFTSSDGVGGREEDDAGRKRSHLRASKITRSSTSGSVSPPSSFGFRDYDGSSFTSISPSMAPSSSPITIRHDPRNGKRGLAVTVRAQPSAPPSKKGEIDVKSLNLHLRARVVEILGCSEEMWEWVKGIQYLESEKERKLKEQRAEAAAAAAKSVRRAGGGRVSYYHHDRNRQARERMNSEGNDLLRRKRSGKDSAPSTSKNGSNVGNQGTFVKVSGRMVEPPSTYLTTSFGSGKGDDPSEHLEESVKKELLHMTRERFDELLSWFQL